MDEVEGVPPGVHIPQIYIEPHHHGPQLVLTQSADIPKVLEELHSRGV